MGIDVGADRLHCVALDGGVRASAVFSGAELAELAAWAAPADVVAVDAPAQLSTRPHAADAALAPKFREARCAEVALGRAHGCWVPWVGPAVAPASGWIRTGLDAFGALRDAGSAELLEVFPYAAFRALARGERLPRKTTVSGLRRRAELLAAAGAAPQSVAMWSHDGLDALVAAVVARDRAGGSARRVTCGHDESAIWLPAAPAVAPASASGSGRRP